ncbi:cytochrome c biogenesis protein CcdA [Mycolicibacterium mucogenicum]|uniref:cytochrome c biogenesis CcdA family protein n=1 Tax=Mycolicibacterium mucogenicum TaxID=56689 RepID=UPI00226AB0BB|nr:cytochrome c biogenesis protein CcdA [Mycolicibacterium mucogenicum]MCX8565144.1 cytochrome c biogenesis protein CcdA [Mycolicibacterium mucogenicum]
MSLLALAFTAGMLAPVNPCGFALLPAWITSTTVTGGSDALPVRLARALRTGAVLTVGFTGTLALAGIAISAGARVIVTAAPWLGIALGVTLIVLGVAALTGRTIGLRMPARMRHSPAAGGVLAAGIGYALASLSCTFGVLLAVIAQAQTTSGWGGLLAVFAAYTAGAATVVMLVSIGTAIAGTALTRHLGVLARHGTRITAVVLIATGTYLAWYWLPTALGHTTSSESTLTAWSATATGWLQDHTVPVAVMAAVAVAATAAARYWAIRHRRPESNTDCRR